MNKVAIAVTTIAALGGAYAIYTARRALALITQTRRLYEQMEEDHSELLQLLLQTRNSVDELFR